jgi:release factor glutamine methyltransferase
MQADTRHSTWRFLRPLARRLLSWRYRLFQTHRHGHLVLEDVAGRPIVVLPEVFNPKLFRSGELLAEVIEAGAIPPHTSVLDLGTGSGVGAVFAARWVARVVAVDINPAAVRCARLNALLHHCEHKVDVRQGDLFAPLGDDERFDTVLFNPPYYPGEPRDALDRAFHATDALERFAAGLGAVLAPGGSALLVVSSDMGLERVVAALARTGFRAETVRREERLNETLVVYRFRRESAGQESA